MRTVARADAVWSGGECVITQNQAEVRGWHASPPRTRHAELRRRTPAAPIHLGLARPSATFKLLITTYLLPPLHALHLPLTYLRHYHNPNIHFHIFTSSRS